MRECLRSGRALLVLVKQPLPNPSRPEDHEIIIVGKHTESCCCCVRTEPRGPAIRMGDEMHHLGTVSCGKRLRVVPQERGEGLIIGGILHREKANCGIEQCGIEYFSDRNSQHIVPRANVAGQGCATGARPGEKRGGRVGGPGIAPQTRSRRVRHRGRETVLLKQAGHARSADHRCASSPRQARQRRSSGARARRGLP